jgi:hypothetical protein
VFLDLKRRFTTNLILIIRIHPVSSWLRFWLWSGGFSFVFFIAIYLPPQTDAGTKTALNELYRAISKEENAHPESGLLLAVDLSIGKLQSFFSFFFLPACHLCN